MRYVNCSYAASVIALRSVSDFLMRVLVACVSAKICGPCKNGGTLDTVLCICICPCGWIGDTCSGEFAYIKYAYRYFACIFSVFPHEKRVRVRACVCVRISEVVRLLHVW